MNRRAGALFVLATAAACRGDTTLTLPDRPEAEVAFTVLYDDAKVAEIGPVVPTALLYSGTYAVTAEASGLEARVFFASAAAVREAALEACRALTDGPARLACQTPLPNCDTSPAACLGVVRSSEGCGARVVLTGPLPLSSYAATEGRLAATSGGADGTSLCGPVVRPECPILAAGLLVTSPDGFRCVAPVEQETCAVTIDLSRCGFDTLTGALDADGALAVRSGRCQVVPVPEGSAVVGAGPYFGLDCGAGVYTASRMDAVLGEVGCLRRGPRLFRTGFPSSEEPGSITGALPVDVRGERDLLLSGSGLDSCGSYGCSLGGDTCRQSCEVACREFTLNECAADDWPTCIGKDQRLECIDVCFEQCNASANRTCQINYGPSLSLTSAAAPEADRTRARLPGIVPRAVRALAPTGDGAQYWAAAGTAAVLVKRDDTALDTSVHLELGFTTLGVVQADADSAFFYGGNAGGGRVVRVSRVSADPPLVMDPLIEVPELRSVDGLALFGADLLALYDRSAASPALWLVPRSGGTATAVGLPGSPNDALRAPDGSVILGLRQPEGPHALARVRPNAGTVAQLTTLRLVEGLEPKALALDPHTCGANAQEGCRVLVALARDARPGPPLLGAAELTAGGLRASSALLELPTPSVDFLVPTNTSVFAVSSRSNGLVEIVLAP